MCDPVLMTGERHYYKSINVNDRMNMLKKKSVTGDEDIMV